KTQRKTEWPTQARTSTLRIRAQCSVSVPRLAWGASSVGCGRTDINERNAMARPDKAAAVAEIKQELESSNAAVLTEYRGLTVAQMKDLRRSLGEHATYAVVKNTLTAIAA